MSELKPCPFCGEGANLGVTEEFRDDCFVVRCYTCGACGGISNHRARAVENWNHRPLEAEMAEALGGVFVHGTLGARVLREVAETIPTPGSPAAVARGCTCPVYDNAHGAGMGQDEHGQVVYVMREDCPLHGDTSRRTKATRGGKSNE